MRYIVTIEMDNAAFEDDARPELARILTRLAKEVRQASTLTVSLRDVNGNRVGTASVEN